MMLDNSQELSNGILKDWIQGAEENRATAWDQSIPPEDRRTAAQAADSSWRSIMIAARRLAEICEQEGAALEPQLAALDPDDFSPEARNLDSLSRVWGELARGMDSLAIRAVKYTGTERRLNAAIADF
ncbi:hypothetical protein ABT282_08730 [Streptomyces sp. NPDC000927]|uniref:hypothetical protein n=1 Tax=Streptomyces sp. NPDC000927 TaxID=3154371 RepID=UPI00332E0812